MASFLSYDSKAGRILTRFAQACYLNLLWAVCSLPLITVGAATCALYSVTLKMAEDAEGDLTQQFFAAFKANFRQATQIWAILLAVGLLLGGDVYVLMHLRSATEGAAAVFWTLVLAVVIAGCVAYVVELLFVFPLLARFDNTTRAMLGNALLIGTHYLNCTLVVFAIHAVMAIVAIAFFTPILLLGEGLCAILSSYLLLPVMRLVATPAGKDAKGGADADADDAPARPGDGCS